MEPYTYNVTVKYVVDGDTVDVDIDLGFGISMNNQRIRLFGVDTPECRSKDLREKSFGLLAKKKVQQFLMNGGVILQTKLDEKGKFGRILGTFFVDGISLNQYLIDNRYAVEYYGQAKQLIKEQHIANFDYLDGE
jgi:micrococcal nuclease